MSNMKYNEEITSNLSGLYEELQKLTDNDQITINLKIHCLQKIIFNASKLQGLLITTNTTTNTQ